LVVVLTLMMIAPFLSDSEMPVDLPEARASEVDDTDNIEITFTLAREIWVGEDFVLLEELQPYLGDLFTDAPHAVAVIKADRNLPYGEVEKLIAEVERSDAPRIALATQEKEGEGP
jgi:biopolymer transport protein TolR